MTLVYTPLLNCYHEVYSLPRLAGRYSTLFCYIRCSNNILDIIRWKDSYNLLSMSLSPHCNLLQNLTRWTISTTHHDLLRGHQMLCCVQALLKKIRMTFLQPHSTDWQNWYSTIKIGFNKSQRGLLINFHISFVPAVDPTYVSSKAPLKPNIATTHSH